MGHVYTRRLLLNWWHRGDAPRPGDNILNCNYALLNWWHRGDAPRPGDNITDCKYAHHVAECRRSRMLVLQLSVLFWGFLCLGNHFLETFFCYGEPIISCTCTRNLALPYILWLWIRTIGYSIKLRIARESRKLTPFLAQDTPTGNVKSLQRDGTMSKQPVHPMVLIKVGLRNYRTWVLAVLFALTGGTEVGGWPQTEEL